jgi:hypothetical protein
MANLNEDQRLGRLVASAAVPILSAKHTHEERDIPIVTRLAAS